MIKIKYNFSVFLLINLDYRTSWFRQRHKLFTQLRPAKPKHSTEEIQDVPFDFLGKHCVVFISQ